MSESEGNPNFGKSISNKDAYFNPPADLRKLLDCVDDFAEAMKQKLRFKYDEGQRGWDNPAWRVDDVISRLTTHVGKGDMVDVANFAMFAWHKKGRN